LQLTNISLEAQVPNKRIATPEEIANAGFIGSDKAS
jgi:hypothetical protein